MFRKIITFITCFTLTFTLASCTVSKESVTSEYFAMGTVITQKVYGKKAKEAVNSVSKRMSEIERLMTVKDGVGDANKINESAGKGLVEITSDTLFVLEKAKDYGKLSEGTFDVTIGKVIELWGINTDRPRIPDSNEIADALKFVNYSDIIINSEKNLAGLRYEGQLIDLGGIAKGFAGDEAIRIYKEKGIKSALINLGGNVVVLGNKPDGSPWKIGIQNPRSSKGNFIGIVEISDKAIVTSGDYERFFEKNGKRYHHIIDPSTGYPAESDLISSTIITDSSVDADALSTSTFIMGLQKALNLIENLDNTEGIFITVDKKVYITEGLKNKFVFKDESREFEYVKKR